MNRIRRSVLAGAALTAAAVAVPIAQSGTALSEPTPDAGLTNTRLAGIDVDAATVPQLQRAMGSGRLSSVALTRFYLSGSSD